MKAITINLYEFDELSEEAKQVACKHVREEWHDFYPWHNDNQKSLKEFAKFLGGKATWNIQMSGYDGPSNAQITDLPNYLVDNDPYRSEDSYTFEDWLRDNSTTIEGDCPFTGYMADEDLLQPMREYLKDPADHTMEQLIQEGCDRWVKNYVADWENCYTDEYISDFLIANEYEFTQHGEFYRVKV